MRRKTRDQRGLADLTQSFCAGTALQTQSGGPRIRAVVETQAAIQARISPQPTQSHIVDRHTRLAVVERATQFVKARNCWLPLNIVAIQLHAALHLGKRQVLQRQIESQLVLCRAGCADLRQSLVGEGIDG